MTLLDALVNGSLFALIIGWNVWLSGRIKG